MWLGNELVGIVRNQQLHAVHTDHLSRPEVVTNAAKTPVWRAQNGAFERTVVQDQIGGLQIGFPGQYHDTESGLVQNWHRDYLPEIGRYIQVDPIGLAGGINSYSYVRGNPASYVDPFGLFCIDQRTKSAISTGIGTFAGAASTGVPIPAALLAGGVAGALDYAAGPVMGGTATGLVLGAASGRSRGAAIAGAAGGFISSAAGGVLGGVSGGIAEAASSPTPKGVPSSHPDATIGPILKGIKGGVVGAAASGLSGLAIDVINDQWGDCNCAS